MRAYLTILRYRGSWRFSAAGLLARSGGAMMGIGIVLMVSALYDSYALAGALSAANGAAWAVGTAVLSGLVDRHGQRRIMYPAAILSSLMLAVVVVLAVLEVPAWVLFVPVMICGATGGAPGALVRARWSNVLDDPRQLHTAFSLESTLDELTFVIGPVVATALATTVHPAAGLVAPVVLALSGAVAFYSQRGSEPPAHPRTGGQGFRVRNFILLTPGFRAVVATNLLIGCVFGSIDVSVVAATTQWDARGSAGVVLAVFSLASAVAGFAYGAREWASPLPRRLVIGVVAMLVATGGLLLADSVMTLAGAGLLVGVTVAPTLINANALIGHLVPRARLTEGLAWMGTGLGIGTAIGSSISGQVLDASGYHAGFTVTAVFAVAAAAITVASWRGLASAYSRTDVELVDVPLA